MVNRTRAMRGAGACSLCALSLLASAAVGQSTPVAEGAPLFTDRFESGLAGWRFPRGQGHSIVARADGAGSALELEVSDAPVYALVRGSEEWDAVRVEGEVLFPSDEHSYLGFIWRYRDDGRRIDFGSLYIKGNGSYLQANPHSDTNVGRTLHPEMRAALDGPRAIEIGAWQRFALEVVGSVAHLYVGDMNAPAMTLPAPKLGKGAFGFKPRVPGAPVQIDNIVVRRVDRFTHRGEPVPNVEYQRNMFATDWSVLGPLSSHARVVETRPFDGALEVEDDGRDVGWRTFEADHRGAVHSGRVTEFRGGRRVAYFHTRLMAAGAGEATLSVSSIDDLAIWVNGEFRGFVSRQSRAWWDALTNEEHRGRRLSVLLREGANDVLVRVVGGSYATGGFYLGVEGGD